MHGVYTQSSAEVLKDGGCDEILGRDGDFAMVGFYNNKTLRKLLADTYPARLQGVFVCMVICRVHSYAEQA